ncbi:MAG: M67 family peptidase [Gaiellales bacterium]|nr:MAG: M67 family peptidase [Gaiellales bacterium]
MAQPLRLSAGQYQSIIDHARACSPEEACGVLAGAGGEVERVFLMENAEHSPTFYMMDSREQFEVFDAIERDGLELVAIFHSHPHSPPLPSAQDMELAFYPDALYLIVSLMGEEPEGRAFRIVEREVTEAGLEVIGDD